MSDDSSRNANDHEEGTELTRRSVLRTTAAAAGASVLPLGVGRASAAAGTDDAFRNWRVREASHAWDRGYRGRRDRAIALTDSGIEARHPDVGPWNGVRAVTRDGEFSLTTDAADAVDRRELDADESFSGTIGPGTFAMPATKRHTFTTPADADELEASLAWTPADDVQDLEFYVENADGDRVVTAATADSPERITADVSGGEEYAFVVETWANVAAEYEIAGDYYAYHGSLSEFTGNVFTRGGSDPAPKVVGWYDENDRYGRYDRPRDPNGHGTHVAGIMGGSGRASAVDPDRVTEDDPRTTLALGESLTYEIDARAETGVYASVYGEFVEVRIEAPNGEELAASTVGTDDTSEWDNNVVEAATVHGEGEATYAVHVTPYDGEILTAARVDRVSVGAVLAEGETDGDRSADGTGTIHAGIAPNASLVGLQGLSGPTADLAAYADEFVDAFNLRTVNMSWGYVGGAPFGAAGGLLTSDPSLVRRIADAGILVAAAAGNAGTPANGNGTPAVADEAISVVATGPLDGIAAYSSGGIAAYDEDANEVYRKPDVTAPGGTATDLARSAKTGDPDASEDEQSPIREYTGKAGTSMASPYVAGISGLIADAMESGDAPEAIRLPEPARADGDDVLRLKQALLATATETALTAAPYHRAHAPTYDFGARDPYEGFGRVNPGAAIDAVTRDLTGTTSDAVGLNLPEDERAVAGYVAAGPGTVDVSVDVSHLSGANAGAAEGDPHVDLFVYDAANPGRNGDPNVLARSQGLDGSASATVSFGRDAGERVLYAVAKLVNVPGVVNGYDVQAHLDVSVDVSEGFFVDGRREDDGSVFTGGQTDRIDVAVDPSERSRVRDVIPAEWTVITEYSDDVEAVEESGEGVKYVYFAEEATADAETTYTYFAEAPDDPAASGEYVFGPAEVAPADRWVAVDGTSDTNVVLGQET
jgi:subtilisin family serine protease